MLRVGALILVALLLGCRPEMDENTAALVNGRRISMADLDEAVGQWTGLSGDQERVGLVRRQVLAGLIEEELILAEAERLGLEVAEEELDRRVAEIKADFPEGTFKESLVRNYLDFETWRRRLRRHMLITKVTENELAARVRIVPRDWEEFFDRHKDLTPRPARLLVRHLSLPDRKQAVKALKLLQSGQDLPQVLRAVQGRDSDFDPGEPVWTVPERLPRPLAEALAKTAVGGVSDIIETEAGYTIFQVLEAEDARPPAAEEVLAEARRKYLEIKRAEAYALWMDGLKSRAAIAINPALAPKTAAGPNNGS
ncbi:MAG: SurA N-terminal domain-containing protein [Thermodesulfobacteriota bacterium]